MRVGILGKGGSGKTTITAALVEYIARDSKVLAIDADQNVNLVETLGIENDVNISDYNEDIYNYLHENRNDLKDVPKIGTTPPGMRSRFIRLEQDDPILGKYAKSKGNVISLQIGSYTEKDIGSTCFHGKQETIEAIYHHLLDKSNEFVIADSTAGLDSLGNSLHMVHDIIFYVVEPTQKSTSVFKRFKDVAANRKIRLYAIANKIRDNSDIDFIKDKIPGDDIISVFKESRNIRDLEKGDPDALNRFVEEHKEQFRLLKDKTQEIKRDWDDYYKKLLREHKTISESWYDGYYGVKISEKIDPDFSYTKIIGMGQDADSTKD